MSVKVNKADDRDKLPEIEIDRLIHEPARLEIMAYLYIVDHADFLFLMQQTGFTFGNLSSHLKRLAGGGYVKIDKEFLGRKPHTVLSLTREGRNAFRQYRENMKQVLENLPE